MNESSKQVVPQRLGAVVLAALLASACGSGDSGTSNVAPPPPPATDAGSGEIMIAITDAEGDFLSYAVDTLSLTLQRANGDTVETIPLSTRIDFTELTEVTEFLTIATVPAGIYTSATLTLDYTAAEIVVQDESGNAISAQPIDSNGDIIGVFDLRLNLPQSDHIRVAPGIPAAFSLDFDLDASNTIDLASDPVAVTVEPFLLATAELESDREHRVRGALAAVDEAASTITLRVLPFRHRNGDFGRFTLNVDEQTQYEVDGVGYTGAEGLTAMTALGPNSPVIANGNISGRSMTAHTVIAGSSVPWTDGDVVKGIVTARSGDSLTVRGARIEYSDGVEVFRGSGTVLLGSTTTVTAPGVNNADLSIDSISVGQRIVAFGELSDDRTLDATDGRVAMRMNQMTARVVTAEPLAVDWYFLNGRRPAVFDFSGTGAAPDLDADPDHYEIDTGAMSLDTLQTDDFVRVRGLVNDFGAAPADFNARTVIDIATEQRPGTLYVGWAGGSAMPFHSLTADQIDIDLSAARELLKLRGVPLDISNPLESAILLPTESGSGIYAVKVRGSGELHIYREFAAMVDELDRQLDSGAVMHRITAHVRYNPDTDGFVTPRASFVLAMPQP